MLPDVRKESPAFRKCPATKDWALLAGVTVHADSFDPKETIATSKLRLTAMASVTICESLVDGSNPEGELEALAMGTSGRAHQDARPKRQKIDLSGSDGVQVRTLGTLASVMNAATPIS